MARKRKDEQAARRAAIVEAARQLFIDLPYGQVTMRKIAVAAGCTTGGIYSNFDTKAAIWREAMGSEPPTDSILTRHAGDLEQVLRALIAAGHTTEAIPASLAEAFAAAETTLARLESRQGLDPLQEPGGEPTVMADPGLSSGGVLAGSARIDLVSDILSLADARGWLAPSFAETTESLTGLCRQLVDHEEGQIGGGAIYEGAVEACALSMVIAIHGVRPSTAL